MKKVKYEGKSSTAKPVKPSSGSKVAGQFSVGSGSKKLDSSASETASYKPGSLLARSGGKLSTVKLTKNAAKKIS